MSELNYFEKELMQNLLAGDLIDLEILRKQYSKLDSVKRTYSEVGVIAEFGFGESVSLLSGARSFQIADVIANVDGVENGVDVILFIKDGMLDSLEYVTFGEELPNEIGNFDIGFISKGQAGKIRDMNTLNESMTS